MQTIVSPWTAAAAEKHKREGRILDHTVDEAGCLATVTMMPQIAEMTGGTVVYDPPQTVRVAPAPAGQG